MKKRLMSILFCLCMTVTLLPAVQISAAAADTISYLDENGDPQSVSAASATQVTSDTTAWSNGWYYVSGDVTISSTVTVSGNVDLILADGADLQVTSSRNATGINVEGSNSLTIYGQVGGSGKLTATGDGQAAGIGGGGSITINGGTVTATGSSLSAGIGGSKEGSTGTITINGGTVTATDRIGTGIGGGFNNAGGGSITINGGTVIANGGAEGAGIGSGGSGSGGPIITINGGTVMATSNGNSSGAGIGGGFNNAGGRITINGGTVTAISEINAGIGGGQGGDGGSITINGGTVTATGGYDGAGIGGGKGGGGGSITINGGSVNAKSNDEGAEAIGHGTGSSDSGTLQNGKGSSVSLTTVAGIMAKTAVTALTTSLTDYTYGTKDMETDAGGKLYLYLPSGTTVTAAKTISRRYAGSVTSGNTGTLSMSLSLTGLTLSNGSVQENVPVSTTVGTLGTETCGSASASFTYQLVSGEGDADNGCFSISGTSLQLAVSPDYETKNSYSIRIRSTTEDGLYFEQPFTIHIENVNDVAPVVSSSDGGITAAAGDAIAVDNHLNVSDLDSDTLSSAAISITSNFQSAQDSLSFTNTDSSTFGNITGSYNASTGVLSLNSSNAAATVTQWQEALRAVEYQYDNGEVTPVTLERTISFQVNDGDFNSAVSTKTINFVPLVLSAVPSSNGAEAVSVCGNIAITFSEPMDASAGTVSLTPSGGSSISLTDGAWSSGNTVYTIPYPALDYNTSYTLAVSNFQDVAGNVMSAYSCSFTTELEPLTPTVTPETLSIDKGSTAGFSVALGQGTAAAASADITVTDGTIASADPSRLTGNGTVVVSGLAVGTTNITIAFNNGITKTVSITVNPAPPDWPAESSLTSSDVTQTGAALTWTAASDINAVTGYRIYQDGTLIKMVDGATLTYSVTGLSVSTTYSFQVQAGNADGAWTTDGPTVTVPTSAAYHGGSSDENGSTTASVTGSDGTSGTVSITTSGGSASAEIGSAQGDALAGGDTLELTMPTAKDAESYGVKLPANDLYDHNTGGTLTMKTDLGSVAVPSNMLSPNPSDKTAEITIGRGNEDQLPDDVKAAIGSRPLIQLTLSIDGTQTGWSNPDAPVTVSIPYTPTAEELANPECIVVWYIDGSGNLVTIPNGHYDLVTRTVVFSTTHFSQYAVGYNNVVFSDVPQNAWCDAAVSFVAARGIMGGTSDTTFSPDAALNRGQFITMLMKAYGIEPETNAADNFSDAGSTYYTGYLEAAKRLGISNGVGDNKFAPEQAISRQQMFTLLYNTLKKMNRLPPEDDSGKTLSGFTDGESVSSYAQEALSYLVKSGVVSGHNGYLLPTATTTRAQMAQVIYNLMET